MEAIERKQLTAVWNDSLYFIMAATEFGSGIVCGRACSYAFGIIDIMNRIPLSVSSDLLRKAPDEPALSEKTNKVLRHRHAL